MAISVKVWLTVKRFSYKFSILCFSEFSSKDHQYHISRYRRQKADPLISKKVVHLLTSLVHLMAITWYLWHHHNHIQVSLVVGNGLADICNNLNDVARYNRSVQYDENSLDDVLGCSTLLSAWHLAESCACAKIIGLWNGLMCASLWWHSYYANTETCGTITETSKHWDRLVSLNVPRHKFQLLNFTCNLD